MELSLIHISDGSVIASIESDLLRTSVSSEEISDNLKKAIVATEDEHFLEHNGVVPKAVIRATLGTFAGLGSSSGGSTLTQQLIKQQVVGDAPTLARKATEIVDALALERSMSKDEILTDVYKRQGILANQSRCRNSQDHWESDVTEFLPSIGTVNISCFVKIVRDRL